MKNHWLVKSEPASYSWDDLVAEGKTSWTGVRNFTARNNLRSMRVGDEVLFYHSVTDKAVVGIAKVVRRLSRSHRERRRLEHGGSDATQTASPPCHLGPDQSETTVEKHFPCPPIAPFCPCSHCRRVPRNSKSRLALKTPSSRAHSKYPAVQPLR